MIHKIIIILLLFISGGAIILIGGGIYFYGIFLAFLIGCLFMGGKPIKVSMPSIRNILVLFFMFLFLIAVRGDSFILVENADISLKFLIIIMFSVYVTTFYQSPKAFFSNVTNVFESLIKFSLVTALLMNLLPALLVDVGQRFVITHDQYQTFLGLAYARTDDFTKYKFYRNQSIFWEPGVYATMITVIYMVKVFYLKEKKRLYWYYIGIFSTVSMGGILIFVMLNIFRWMSGTKETGRGSSILVKLLIALPIFTIFDLIYYYSTDVLTLFGLVFHRKLSSDSSINTRYQDLYYGFLASKDEILTGHGQDYSAYYKVTFSALNTSKEAYGGGITNSIITILYCYGVFYLLVYIILMFKSAMQLSHRNALLIFFTLIALLMLEPLNFSLFMVYIFTFREEKIKLASPPVVAGPLFGLKETSHSYLKGGFN